MKAKRPPTAEMAKELRKVSLEAVRQLAKKRHDAKRAQCYEIALSGGHAWHELHPHRVIMDIFDAMTPEGYQLLLDSLYPENPSNATPVPKEQLYRYRHQLGGSEGDFDN